MEEVGKGRTEQTSFPLLNLWSFSPLIFLLALDISLKGGTLSTGRIPRTAGTFCIG